MSRFLRFVTHFRQVTLLTLLTGVTPVSPLSAVGQVPTPAAAIMKAATERQELRNNSRLGQYPVRNVGPIVQGGRIVDIEVDPRSKKTFYCAYASGGLFVTRNNGVTFSSIFDNQAALGIGDIALSKSNPDVIWVGTGENNSSRSSYSGLGVYRSTNAGKSWKHCGLDYTHHIGRIITHPTDENVAWVGSIGPLYSKGEGRGVFKTTDGGDSWERVFYLNDSTGVIDMVIHPTDPNTLWAATWDRHREAWNFRGEGSSTAIYKSVDGGKNWKLSSNGLPLGDKAGRIGIDIAQSDPNILYAVIDNQNEEEKTTEEDTIAGLSSSMFLKMSKEKFLELTDAKLDSFLTESGFPKRYDARVVKKSIKKDEYKVEDIANYFGDANEALFKTKIKGAEVYRSEDGGANWTLVNSYQLGGVFFTYGYYFGQMRVSPKDPNKIYTCGVPFLKSSDGGKTWGRIDSGRVHVDHHAIWIDPDDPEHMLLGNDGGLYVSYDDGASFLHMNNLPVGQFYTVAVDNAKPYQIYGGLQDNGVYYGSSQSRPGKSSFWKRLGGGDGMFIALDEKNNLAYTGWQFGHYFRINRENGKRTYVTPKHNIGSPKYRFNWRTPFKTSTHHKDILYMASQYLLRSMDQGDSWEEISPDLTTNREQGNVPYSTITTFSESPKKFGLIWVGSDDGKIHITRDGGNEWDDISNGIPKGLWVSRIQASPHDEAKAVVSLTGYRFDDFRCYVYATDDYGKTWQSIQNNLPDEPVNCIIEDPAHEDLYYLGTDHATYASMDGGQTWELFSQIPNVASYDLVIQERENELIVATHGRSIYVMSIEELRKVASEKEETLITFEVNGRRYSKKWGEATWGWQIPDTPSVNMRYFIRSNDKKEALKIRVTNEDDKKVHETQIESPNGYGKYEWNLINSGKGKKSKSRFIGPGTYKVEYSFGSIKKTEEFEIQSPRK